MKKIISLILSLVILFGSINNTSFGSVATPVISSRVKSVHKPIRSSRVKSVHKTKPSCINKTRKQHVKISNKISNKEIMLGVTLIGVISLIGYLLYKISKKSNSDSNVSDTSENKSFIKFKLGGKEFSFGYQ